MQQADLLSDSCRIYRDHLDIELHGGFLSETRARTLLDHLLETTPWQQPRVKVWGKWHRTPRLVALYGNKGLHYAYSETLHGALPWTAQLTRLKQQVEKACTQRFNAVLLNYYRDGQDTMGWHADDETELGLQPCIASLSLGAARDIHFRPKSRACPPVHLNLQHGSLLLMRGDTQQHWQHHVPRRASCREPRLNLTFRFIYPDTPGAQAPAA